MWDRIGNGHLHNKQDDEKPHKAPTMSQGTGGTPAPPQGTAQFGNTGAGSTVGSSGKDDKMTGESHSKENEGPAGHGGNQGKGGLGGGGGTGGHGGAP